SSFDVLLRSPYAQRFGVAFSAFPGYPMRSRFYLSGYESITGCQKLPPLWYLDIPILVAPPVLRFGPWGIYS
ncbi:hypothetical protein M1N47_00915, partial [Dehalococcoidia bacterium]|nr:hypothetical protein [Dehalococcoidia bacterium]